MVNAGITGAIVGGLIGTVCGVLKGMSSFDAKDKDAKVYEILGTQTSALFLNEDAKNAIFLLEPYREAFPTEVNAIIVYCDKLLATVQETKQKDPLRSIAAMATRFSTNIHILLNSMSDTMESRGFSQREFRACREAIMKLVEDEKFNIQQVMQSR